MVLHETDRGLLGGLYHLRSSSGTRLCDVGVWGAHVGCGFVPWKGFGTDIWSRTARPWRTETNEEERDRLG